MTIPHRWVMEAVASPLTRQDFEPETPDETEVIVEVAGCGVCHTDLGFLYDGVRTNQPLPLALGHEISGRVVATGKGAGNWQGKAVIVPAVIPCGRCDHCKRGVSTICRQQKMPGNDVHGGFATHVRVPAYGLCFVDETRLSTAGLELADVSVLADAITTPYQAAVQSQVAPGDLVIVIGVGGVGGYAVQIASALGAKVVALDIDPAKLEKLRGFGADLLLDARDVQGRELKKTVLEFANDNGLRDTEWKIFECSGTAAGQLSAYALLTHGATLAVVGFTMEKVEVRLSNLMAFHARALGNWGCAPEHYPEVLAMVLDGRIAVKPFIERHPLADVNRVLEAARAHQLAERAILVPGA